MKRRKIKMEKNVIVAVFKVESEGYQALSKLKMTPEGKPYFITAATLVKKENNRSVVLDGFDTGADTVDDTLKGELIGMIVGILGGPIGMLLGAGFGALIGMNVDAEDTLLGASMLELTANKLDDGMVALIALADEESPDELDAILSEFDTVIARFDADAVENEVDEACDMQNELARQVRMKLRKEKKEEIKEVLMENSEILSENFKK